jgi:hypothetical protein
MDRKAADLEQRLRRLEDIEEIKKLRARYIEACDGGWDGRASHNTEKILSFFTEDCLWEGAYGRREGRAALRKYYEEGSASDALAYHILSSPAIDVDGDHARGNWHLTILLTLPDQSSLLVGGVLDDEYVRTPEGWRIKRTRFSLALTGKYEKGWSLPKAAT